MTFFENLITNLTVLLDLTDIYLSNPTFLSSKNIRASPYLNSSN